MIQLNKNIDISAFTKVKSFIKRKYEGYEPKEAKPLTEEQVEIFIETAPDEIHLATKVSNNHY
jgi:hypothetical protein